MPRYGEETGVCPLHLLADTKSEYLPNLDLLSYFPDKAPQPHETLPSPDTVAVRASIDYVIRVCTCLNE